VTTRSAPSVREEVQLGATVVAQHPSGQRVSGQVVGFGPVGILISASGFNRTLLLRWTSGWAVHPPQSAGPVGADLVARLDLVARDVASTTAVSYPAALETLVRLAGFVPAGEVPRART
jgi:hypothetical protein